MGTPRRTPRPLTVVALLAWTLTACSSDTATTGWIPSNGTISGVITTTSAFPVSPRASGPAILATAGGTVLALPTPPSIASFIPRLPRMALRARRPRGARPGATPHDLIVTFRHGALGAPALGAAALASAPSARAFGRAIRSRLGAILPPGVVVAGVSPAILTARVRVADTTQRDAVAAALRRDPAVAAVTRNRLMWRGETAYVPAQPTDPAAAAARARPHDTFYALPSLPPGLIDLPPARSTTTRG